MSEAEWQTRKQRIDTRLRAMQPAWKILRYHNGLDLSALHCVAVEEFPTANGPTDYALFVHGELLGIATPQGNKFANEYEIYSQKFQKEDFGDDDPFDPKMLPNEYLTTPNVLKKTIVRLATEVAGLSFGKDVIVEL